MSDAQQIPLDRFVVVLDEPKNVVNIAGMIRVMMNMGLSKLRLVNPDDFDAYRIEGIAHRSNPIIRATETFTDLTEAVADARYVIGTSARARAAKRNYTRPRAAAPNWIQRAEEGPVAILFGREDRGLSNEALDLCHEIAIIPTDTEYSSLNLAQAGMVIAYEIFVAAQGSVPESDLLPEGKRARITRAATSEDMEEMYDALRDGLDRIDFFKARQDVSVMRTLRTMLHRSEPSLREARLVRAIGFEITNYLDRVVGSDGPASEEE